MQGLRVLTRSGAAPSAEEIASAHIVANTHKEMKFGVVAGKDSGVDVEYHAYKNTAFVNGGGGAWVTGIVHLNPNLEQYLPWRWKSGDSAVTVFGVLPDGTGAGQILAIAKNGICGGLTQYASTQFSRRHWLATLWGAGANSAQDITDYTVFGTLVPRTVGDPLYLRYRFAHVFAITPDARTVLCITQPGATYIKCYLWREDTGPIDLGFLNGISSIVSSYPYPEANISSPIAVADDGATVIANHRGDSFCCGGTAFIAARWTATTGWERLPIASGYPIPTHDDEWPFMATGASADTNTVIGAHLRTINTTGYVAVAIWKLGIGTYFLPPALSGLDWNAALARVSPSGVYAVCVDVAGTAYLWSDADGFGPPLVDVFAKYVDDAGTIYGASASGNEIIKWRRGAEIPDINYPTIGTGVVSGVSRRGFICGYEVPANDASKRKVVAWAPTDTPVIINTADVPEAIGAQAQSVVDI